MKIVTYIVCAFALVIVLACSNKKPCLAMEKGAFTTHTQLADKIVGSWIPIALDFTLDGSTEPTGNWKFSTTKEIEDAKKAGFDIADGCFNFKANGKGFFGKKDNKDAAFTYKKLANGKYVIKALGYDEEPKNTKAENTEEFYLNPKGQLIYHHSSKPLIMGKYIIQNSFELYKKK